MIQIPMSVHAAAGNARLHHGKSLAPIGQLIGAEIRLELGHEMVFL